MISCVINVVFDAEYAGNHAVDSELWLPQNSFLIGSLSDRNQISTEPD